tara:strand:+ start:1869 stop:4073 length:2205 start_codon:yes stop_codon:yes gene_type:complete
MINTTKFLPRRTEKKSVLSEKTVINFRIIKKDFKRIDDTLKERLVLSKVRAGILRDQLERARRRENENTLEKRKEDDGTDFDPTQEPKKRGNQGLLTTLFAGLIGGIGFVIVKAIPLFKTIFKTLSAIARPIIAIVRSVGALLAGIKGRLFPAVNDLEDKEKKSRKDIKDLPNRINQVGNQLQFLANAMVFNTVLGMIFTGVGAGKVKGIVNVARSKKLLTAASAVKIQKQLVAQKKVARTVGIKKRIIKAADLAESGSAVTTNFAREGRKISKKFAKDVTEESVEIVEKGVKTLTAAGIDSATLRQMGVDPSLGQFGAKVPRNIPKSPFGVPGGRVGPPLGGISGSFGSTADIMNQIFKVSPKGIISKPTQIADEILKSFKITDVGLGIDFSSLTNAQKREFVFIIAENKFAQLFKREPKNLDELLDFVKSGDFIAENFGLIRKAPIRPSMVTNVPLNLSPLVDPTAGSKFITPTIPKVAKTVTRTATKGFSKQVLRQTLGAVPLLGDLAVLLLDIYVFKEIPARAGFKTIGSILGSVIGGLLGGLAATATAGTGAILIPALTILGSIGGDILGGVLYDFLDRSYSDYGPFKKPDSGGKTKISDVGRAGVSGTVKGSTIGKVVKDAGGVIKKGVFENKGNDEFLFDSDTYMAFNKAFPGLLETANSLEGDDSISAISERLSYEKKGRRLTRMIPIPIPEVSKNASQNEGSIMTNKKQEVSMLAMNTQTLYRRS